MGEKCGGRVNNHSWATFRFQKNCHRIRTGNDIRYCRRQK